MNKGSKKSKIFREIKHDEKEEALNKQDEGVDLETDNMNKDIH
jgi:hypothetical protein